MNSDLPVRALAMRNTPSANSTSSVGGRLEHMPRQRTALLDRRITAHAPWHCPPSSWSARPPTGRARRHLKAVAFDQPDPGSRNTQPLPDESGVGGQVALPHGLYAECAGLPRNHRPRNADQPSRRGCRRRPPENTQCPMPRSVCPAASDWPHAATAKPSHSASAQRLVHGQAENSPESYIGPFGVVIGHRPTGGIMLRRRISTRSMPQSPSRPRSRSCSIGDDRFRPTRAPIGAQRRGVGQRHGHIDMDRRNPCKRWPETILGVVGRRTLWRRQVVRYAPIPTRLLTRSASDHACPHRQTPSPHRSGYRVLRCRRGKLSNRELHHFTGRPT